MTPLAEAVHTAWHGLPEGGRTVAAVAKRAGVARSSASEWIRKLGLRPAISAGAAVVYTPGRRAEIVAAYREHGCRLLATARALGIPYASAHRVLTDEGVLVPRVPKHTARTARRVVELGRAGLTAKAIERQLGRELETPPSSCWIREALERGGVHRTREDHRRAYRAARLHPRRGWAREQVLVAGRAIADVAREAGVSKSTVEVWTRSERLRRQAAALRAFDVEVARLRVVERLTHDEIAVRLGVSRRRVNTSLRRSELLRVQLRAEERAA